MDIANDLNEILPRIHPEMEDPYAGLAAGAKQHAGLTRSAGAVKRAIEDLREEMSEAEGRNVTFEEAQTEFNKRNTKKASLTKEATSECRHCDFIARDPYELTDHQNEKHLGKKRKRTDRLKDVREQVGDEPRDAWSMGIVPYRERGNRW